MAGDRVSSAHVIAIGVWFLLAAAPAGAHLVETGFGDFYDGAAHVLITPADLLVVIALSLLAGQKGAQVAHRLLFAIPLVWLAAIAIGLRWPLTTVSPILTTASFMLAGGLVASNPRLPEALVVALAVCSSMLHGLSNGSSMAKAGAVSLLAISGMITAIFVIVAVVSAEVTTLKAGWSRIAVRVGGSWIAAAGLLMIGWLSKGGYQFVKVG